MSLAFSVSYKNPQLHKILRNNSVNIMNHLTFFFFLLNRLNLSKSKQQMLIILSMLALKKKEN